jgi:hypothetical protein
MYIDFFFGNQWKDWYDRFDFFRIDFGEYMKEDRELSFSITVLGLGAQLVICFN